MENPIQHLLVHFPPSGVVASPQDNRTAHALGRPQRPLTCVTGNSCRHSLCQGVGHHACSTTAPRVIIPPIMQAGFQRLPALPQDVEDFSASHPPVRCEIRDRIQTSMARLISYPCLLLAFNMGCLAAPDFARDVKPILERSCFACHGPEKQKSGYRLDFRDFAIKGGDSGNPAIVPHKSKESLLIRYVSGDDPEMLMPPKKSEQPRLTPTEIATLKAWIDAGPAWPEELSRKPGGSTSHWSLTSLKQPQRPRTEANPIDDFIRSRLREAGIHPSPVADRATLIRRLSYGLTGLPPSPEAVASFVADSDLRGTEKLIERLLASPHYGEHWARHWLDVAHYADTHGHDHDYARTNAWPYRDYVVRSLNEDKPYSRFIDEQIAGDVLFPHDPQATVGLGFLAAGPWDETLMVGVREDTFDHRFAQVLDRDDIITTVMSTFQSLTVHCARCHNHKFDPISQREYYSLQAVFAGVDRVDRPYDEDPAMNAKRRALLARKHAISRRDAGWLKKMDGLPPERSVHEFTRQWRKRSEAWQCMDIISITNASGSATRFERQPDGSWFVEGAKSEKDVFIVTAGAWAQDTRALRLEALPDPRLPGHGPGRYDPTGNFHLTEFDLRVSEPGLESKDPTRILFHRATATHGEENGGIANALDGRPETLWGIHPKYGEAHEAVFELRETTVIQSGASLVIRLEQAGKPGHQLGRFRLSYCTSSLPPAWRPPLPAALTSLLEKPAHFRSESENAELTWKVLETEVDQALEALPPARLVYAVASEFPSKGSFKPPIEPRPIHVLARGDLNQPRELVEPGALGCIQGLEAHLSMPNPGSESARRAAFARWLSNDRNALTWRSIVNRVWHYHFGRGLCDSPNDFGEMGGRPSHPELLDWLATWFRDEARGSIKSLHRLILTSNTYGQAVAQDPAAAAKDPDNRLLWRMNRTRLSAEQLRDSLLQASGELDFKMGGPAVVQFVHRGKATFMPDGGAPAFVDYESFSPDAPEHRRRSLYRFVFRTVPDPFMDVLDAPDGGALTPARSHSTTALQAFALLNNAFVVRRCERIAARAIRESPGRDPIVRLFQLLVQRNPTARELTQCRAYTEKHGLANACQILVNGNEFLHLD